MKILESTVDFQPKLNVTKISYGLANEIPIKQIMQKDCESIFSKPFQIKY
jgi:hypothetical protein